MSNPLTGLRQLINPGGATRGVVVEVTTGLAKVATSRGLVEAPAGQGVRAGALVTITSGRVYLTGAESHVYWV